MTTIRENNYPWAAFGVLAKIEPNLRTARINGIVLSRDGTRIKLMTTEMGERIADKRALGCYERGDGHTLDVLVAEEGVILLSGTPGIQDNPQCTALISGVQSLLTREGKTVLVCGRPTGQVAYYLYADMNARPVDLTASGMDFAQVVYMPKPRGFVGREKGSRRLWFLPFQMARTGQIDRTCWITSHSMDGVIAITALPPRIQNARAVMVKTVIEGGYVGDDTMDLRRIASGQISSVASQVGQSGITFRGFTSREIAVIEVDEPMDGFEDAGTYEIATRLLTQVFGKAGAKLIEVVV